MHKQIACLPFSPPLADLKNHVRHKDARCLGVNASRWTLCQGWRWASQPCFVICLGAMPHEWAGGAKGMQLGTRRLIHGDGAGREGERGPVAGPGTSRIPPAACPQWKKRVILHGCTLFTPFSTQKECLFPSLKVFHSTQVGILFT